jgi:TolA-binding protein
MVTALAALAAAPLAALASVYGARVQGRTAREGGAIDGYNTLTDQLQEELATKSARVATLEARLATAEAEAARLRLLVTQLGGTP